MNNISKDKNILYLGSGKSINLINHLNLNDYTIVCVNNSWRIFNETNQIDFWIHSGDFPKEQFPKQRVFKKEISHKEYRQTANKMVKLLNIKTDSTQHYLGYTIFFLGVYWIISELKPKKISLLGFDHDYNKEKIIRWNKEKRPNLQNQFNNKKEKTIKEWANNFFKNMEKDSFYGHGTPDPLRLGEEHLISKFKQLILNCERLNVGLVNLSPVNSINPIKKQTIPYKHD